MPQGSADEFTAEGVALLDDPALFLLGGNGANTACVLARLGDLVELASAIGGDVPGRLAAGWLDEAGVGLEALRRDADHATACTAVATDRGRRRIALHHAGASRLLEPGDVPARLVARAGIVLLTSYHLLPRFRGEAGAEFLRTARAAGAVTALDVGPCVEPVAGLEELRALAAAADLVLGNAGELAAVTGAGTPEDGAAALLAAGAGAVVIKEGAAGARWLADGMAVSARGLRVAARSTVGAGDAFGAGLLHALGRGLLPAEALAFANATAALTLERGGSLAAPAAAEVEAALEAGV